MNLTPMLALEVVADAERFFNEPTIRLHIDHTEFAFEAGSLHQRLLDAYVVFAAMMVPPKMLAALRFSCFAFSFSAYVGMIAR